MSDKEKSSGNAAAYWKANLNIIIWTLVIWGLVSYVLGIILVPPLQNISLGYLPLGFWFAQQGSMFIFVILIFVYSKLMDKVDQEHDVHE